MNQEMNSPVAQKLRMERHHRQRREAFAHARPAHRERDQEAAAAHAIRDMVERQYDNAENAENVLVERQRDVGGFDPFTRGSSPDTAATMDTPSSSSNTRGSSAATQTDSNPFFGIPTSSSIRSTSTSSSSTRPSSTVDTETLDPTTSSSSSSTRSSSSLSTSTLPTPTSTSSSSSSTSSSSSSTSFAPISTSSSSSSAPLTSTSVQFITASSSSSAPTLAASATPSSSSDGPGAGPIIGIVAGALAGVVIISGIVGYLFKKYNRKSDPYEANPFDKEDFRRHSAMIPDAYDDDDGTPSMTQHNMGGDFDTASIVTGGGMAGMGALAAHNEGGGPRPPTMFQRHINGPATSAQMYNSAPSAQVGGLYAHGGEFGQPGQNFRQPFHDASPMPIMQQQQQRSMSPAPQLPPLAAFGGDPYSAAGIASNTSNPYAHLDRGHGAMPPRQQAQPQAYANLDRSGSQGSRGSSEAGPQSASEDAYSRAAAAIAAGLADNAAETNQSPPSPPQQHRDSQQDFDTAGRPGTSEGRSGTPDIPNMQQTFFTRDSADVSPGAGLAEDDDQPGYFDGMHGGAQPGRASTGPNDFQSVEGTPQLASPIVGASGSVDPFSHHVPTGHESVGQAQGLSVRNLMPNPHADRPLSTASSMADPDDAYGGVY